MSADHGRDHGAEALEGLGPDATGHSHQVELPGPSPWPMILAAGITLFCAGFALGAVVGVVGFLTLAIALGGWIQEMRHGH